MRYAPVLDALAPLGSAKWEVHYAAQDRARAGREVIDLTIGNPDVATPPDLVEAAALAMRAGRTTYSSGRGEPGLREVLAARYSTRAGRPVGADQVLCFPGTQTALYAVMRGIAEPGTEVIVGDPMYATYEAVVVSSGARVAPVPLRPERGFRFTAEDIDARVTPRTRAILLNTPHNPTGAVLRPEDLVAIGEIARRQDLWIISDEVYEELVFDGASFASPFDRAELADRTIVVSSISKSHAAPGFRSGWAVGSAEFAARLLPLSETMLFGNQPFIADMTAAALRAPSTAAAGKPTRCARVCAIWMADAASAGSASTAFSSAEPRRTAVLDGAVPASPRLRGHSLRSRPLRRASPNRPVHISQSVHCGHGPGFPRPRRPGSAAPAGPAVHRF